MDLASPEWAFVGEMGPVTALEFLRRLESELYFLRRGTFSYCIQYSPAAPPPPAGPAAVKYLRT